MAFPEKNYSFAFLDKNGEQITSASLMIDKALLLDEKQKDVVTPAISEQISATKHHQISKVDTFQIPSEITEMIKNRKHHAIYGISTSSKVAWMTCDNILMIWDFCVGKHQIIKESNSVLSAFLLIDTPSDFEGKTENSSFLMIMATDQKFILFTAERSPDDLFELSQKIEIPNKNVKVEKMINSRNGDVFVTDDNGNLYELQYKGWGNKTSNYLFGPCRKLQKLNRNFALESLLVPIKRAFGHKQTKFISLDTRMDQNGTLIFALDENKSLFCWRKAESYSNVSFVTSIDNIIGKNCTGEELQSLLGQKLIAVHSLKSFESEIPIVFIVTQFGARIYFSLAKEEKYKNFKFVGVSLSLQDRIKNSKKTKGKIQETQPEINQTFYNKGMLLMSESQAVLKQKNLLAIMSKNKPCEYEAPAENPNQERSNKEVTNQRPHKRSSKRGAREYVKVPINESERIQTLSSERNQLMREKRLIKRLGCVEFYEKFDCKNDVFSIAELPEIATRTNVAFYCYAENSSVPFEKMNPESLSFVSAPRTFYVMTSSEFLSFRDEDAIRQLEAISNEDYRNEKLNRFLEQHGRDEASATSLAIVCCDIPYLEGVKTPMTLKTSPASSKCIMNATSAYFTTFGGKLEPLQSTEKPKAQEGIEIADYKQLNFKPSGRLNGLMIFLSRVLRPLWRYPVIGETETKQLNSKIVFIVYPEEILQEILVPLERLNDFLSKHKQLFYTPCIITDSSSSEKTPAFIKCAQEEISRVESLHKLLIRAAELVHFLIRFRKWPEKFIEVYGLMPLELKNALLETTFKEMICVKGAENVIRELMRALATSDAEDMNYLKRKCPSLYRADDYFICNGVTLLDRAEKMGVEFHDQERFRELLESSDIEFLNAIDVAGKGFPLREIAQEQINSKNWLGSLKLCLKLLQVVQREEEFTEYKKSGFSAEKREKERNAKREDKYEKVRKDCNLVGLNTFRMILEEGNDMESWLIEEVSRQKAEMRKIICKADQDAFLRRVFEFLMEKGHKLYLLSFHSHSPLLIEFVVEKCRTDIAYARLAFAIFVEDEKFFVGAKLSRFWAVSGENLTLKERREFVEQSQRFISSIVNPSKEENVFDMASKQYLMRIEIQEKLLENLKTATKDTQKDGIVKKLQNSLVSTRDLFRVSIRYKVFSTAMSLLRNQFLEDPSGKLTAELVCEMFEDVMCPFLEEDKKEQIKSQMKQKILSSVPDGSMNPVEFVGFDKDKRKILD